MQARNKGLSLSYIYFIVNTVLTIGVTAFIVRSVGQTDYGVYQTVAAFAAYLVLLEFGTGNLMSRNIALCKKDGTDDGEINKNVSTIWSLAVILTGVIVLVSVGFYFSISFIYSNSLSFEQVILAKKLFIFIALNLLFSFLSQTLEGLTIGYEHYVFSKALMLIKVILRSALIVGILLIDADILLVTIIDASIGLIVFLVYLFFCVFKLKSALVFKYFDKQVFKIITPLCLAMMLQIIVNTVNSSVDKFLISIMMTPEDVSIYAISMTIFTLFSSIACVPLAMYVPKVASDMKSGLKGKELTHELNKPCRLNALLLSLIAFGFLSFGRQFLSVVYGKVYEESWIYAIIILFPVLLSEFNIVMNNVLDVALKRHVKSFVLVITTAANLVMTIFAIKIIGMLGAALATCISILAQVIILNIYYKKKLDIDIKDMFFYSFKGVLPCVLIATAFSFPIRYVPISVWAQFLIGCGAFILVFAVTFLLFGANEDEKNLIRKIKNKLLKKQV